MSEIPEWLKQCPARSGRPLDRPEVPSVGEIWIAETEQGDRREHVLIVGLPWEQMTQVLLCSPEVDLAADTDAVLGRELTGMPYEMLVHGDLTAPVPAARLWRRAGLISVRLARRLATRGLRRDLLLDHGRGLPILGPSDARWDWKLAELENLYRVAATPEQLGL